ncbi:MAG: hypothetical protein M1812_001596 [Candelaria pacifica]|nr:MAG: hypothetical protein M1812_001596 [Candelaria pacifica]
MASIFSFDPDPPRVSSPWLVSGTATPTLLHGNLSAQRLGQGNGKEARLNPQPSLLADSGIIKLKAEPQEGPTEYKLHLLLRPRRSFSASSTGQHISGSYHSRLHNAAPPSQNGVSQGSPARAVTPSNQSRQNRLQQLTTQLLWRLQQSSPYHASSTSDLVLPNLPEATSVLGTPSPRRPLPGLEESRGALYEIGVSDDGTLVGLTGEEMDESLNNLEAMAGSLGCRVKVLRLIVVGDCEWIEGSPDSIASERKIHAEKLWVAEALVKPDVDPSPQTDNEAPPVSTIPSSLQESSTGVEGLRSSTEQLRVSLTGSTTSGKSTLLGTLSTATLDNGRGKSRLSLLKHRHEIQSGLTSSVAQELIGYRETNINDNGYNKVTEVINYASGNVSSWNDVHSSSEDGRLVFLSDSAGHPRFRRTTVRGLVGWSPHWTVLCVAANAGHDSASGNGSTSSALDTLGSFNATGDLLHAHLVLCLKLKLPLLIAITKLDLASKAVLKQNLAKVLTTLKSNGRKPVMLPTSPVSSEGIPDLQYLDENDKLEVNRALREIKYGNHEFVVPIVLTSAVSGTGISKMHALLHSLPIPNVGHSQRHFSDIHGQGFVASRVLFHVEDIYTTPIANEQEEQASNGKKENLPSVLSGHLRYGELSIGDELLLGPFPALVAPPPGDDIFSSSANSTPSKDIDRVSRSLSRTRLIPDTPSVMASQNTDHASKSVSEWRCVRIISVRNLRVPMRTLSAGQVGTVGISLLQPAQPISESSLNLKSGLQQIPSLPLSPSTAIQRIRKGMVITHSADRPVASDGFVGLFNRSDLASMSLGSLVVVYIASVRATARIVSLDSKAVDSTKARADESEDSEDMFGFDHGDGGDIANSVNHAVPSPTMSEVTFRFVTCREWIELGTQVLVMPGGGPGLYVGSERGEKGVGGLEGFVGSIVRVC